jgi:hypothetical protein
VEHHFACESRCIDEMDVIDLSGTICSDNNEMKKLCLPLIAVAVLFSACVPSLHSLYTEETTVFREELLGTWKEEPQKADIWTFTKREDGKSYTLTIKDERVASSFHARLVKLGDHLFLDLIADADTLNEKVGDLYRASLIPAHLIIKLKVGTKLEMQMLEREKVTELLKGAPKTLAHTFIEDDYLVLTAATPELQAFFRKHAESKELWGDPAVMQKQAR